MQPVHTHPAAFKAPAPWSLLVNFEGLPSPENLDALLSRVETLVVQRTADRRVFRAVIECVQNLERHADPDRQARFVLSGRPVLGEPRFFIRSLNPIQKEDLGHVEQWFSRYIQLQKLAADSISNGEVDWRSLHRKWLAHGERTARGGAGLGWVSLARLALQPPKLRIIDSSDGANLYFSVEVRSAS